MINLDKVEKKTKPKVPIEQVCMKSAILMCMCACHFFKVKVMGQEVRKQQTKGYKTVWCEYNHSCCKSLVQ